MKTLRLSSLLACLLFLTRLGCAEEPALAEKIQDISPDKRFAMRIRYDAEMYRKMFPAEKSDAGNASAALERGIKEQYFFTTIRAVALVSLPEKAVVAELPWDGSAEQLNLVWSPDSKWCALYAETARWGLSWVYYLRVDQFVPLSENEQAGADDEGNERGSWVTPLEIDVEGDVLHLAADVGEADVDVFDFLFLDELVDVGGGRLLVGHSSVFPSTLTCLTVAPARADAPFDLVARRYAVATDLADAT